MNEDNKYINIEKVICDNSEVIGPGIDNFDFIHYTMKGIRRKSDIFPLKKIPFEGTFFWAPNNPNEYLKSIFNNYMKIPYDMAIAKHSSNRTETRLVVRESNLSNDIATSSVKEKHET